MSALRDREKLGKYKQKSVRGRIEAFLLDNVGQVVTRAQIQNVAKDPQTGREPENWHQRLSELRTDHGYTILTARDDKALKVGEYLLSSAQKRAGAAKRIICSRQTWQEVLDRARNTCEWDEGGVPCRLEEGSIDPIGGGTVRLTADHMTPHSMEAAANPDDPIQWRALCGRHQVMKKNYWDSSTGKLNVYAIVQSASIADKRLVYDFLRPFFEK